MNDLAWRWWLIVAAILCTFVVAYVMSLIPNNPLGWIFTLLFVAFCLLVVLAVSVFFLGILFLPVILACSLLRRR